MQQVMEPHRQAPSFTGTTYITMILNQTNTHMVLLLSGITLRQHIMLTSAIEGKVDEARSRKCTATSLFNLKK